ncbi:MAG: hypothetical protein HC924_13120 [Synechococcaceae cyanobacterium SM2_3_2]|nr:hypothetical protein [Synechococcaceae cyanobacterium SM2_3_2]
MKQAFVASLKITDSSQLVEILQQHFPSSEKTYSFLRWPHQVSGIQPGIPDNLNCQEGHVFSKQGELRWKQSPQGVHLLYLGITPAAARLKPLPGNWTFEDYEADLYGDKQNQETRFPNALNYPKNLKVGQRYFVDTVTARVHFVALTLR